MVLMHFFFFFLILKGRKGKKVHENKFSERALRSAHFTNQIQNQNMVFNLLMSQWNCNNFYSLEIIAARKKTMNAIN